MTFDEVIEKRRSNRRFDPEVEVPKEVIEKALLHATYAANSSNMQLYEFHWVTSEDLKKQMVPACMSQGAARTAKELIVVCGRRDLWRKRVAWHKELIDKDAEKLGEQTKSIVLRRRYYEKLMPWTYINDGFGIFGIVRRMAAFFIGLKQPIYRAKGNAQQKVTVHKSAALASQNLMMSLTAQGYDSCPMEGFDEVRVRKILGLDKGAEITMILAVGKGTDKGIWGPRIRVPFEEVVKVH